MPDAPPVARDYGLVDPAAFSTFLRRYADLLRQMPPQAAWLVGMADPDPTLARELMGHHVDQVILAYVARDEAGWRRHGGEVVEAALRLTAKPGVTADLLVLGVAMAIALGRSADVDRFAEWFAAHVSSKFDLQAFVGVLLLSVWNKQDQALRNMLAAVDKAEREAGEDDREDASLVLLLFDMFRAGCERDDRRLAAVAGRYEAEMRQVLDALLREFEADPAGRLFSTDYLCDLAAVALLRMLCLRGASIPASPFFDASFAIAADIDLVAGATWH